MKSPARGHRKLASLRKELRHLRLAHARVFTRKVRVRGDLSARILSTQASICKLRQDLRRRTEVA